MQNRLDQLIGWFAPRRALQRVQARASAQAMARAYDGAQSSRQRDGWTSPNTSAEVEVGNAWARLVANSRDLVRNNAYAARMVDVRVSNDVGNGIVTRFDTGNESRNKRLSQRWEEWAGTTACDAEGEHDWPGLQALIYRTVVTSGECLVRLRTRRLSDDLPVPLQLEVLEGDYLDRSRQQGAGNNAVIDGVEFDLLGRRVAYWLLPYHPGGDGSRLLRRGGLESRRVPADEVLHVYRKHRPGQVRGVPDLAPVMTRLRDLDDYHTALLYRAKIEACLAAFVKQPEDSPGSLADTETQNQQKLEGFEPGMIAYLRRGEEVEIKEPQGSGAHQEYTKTALQATAVGTGITYDQLTGDLSDANYSSLRAGRLEARRLTEQTQRHLLIPRLCKPVVQAFGRHGVLAGRWSEGSYAAHFTPPAHDLVDPAKDADAILKQVRMGTKTLGQAIAEMGFDPQRQLAEIEAWNKALDNASIVLDSDPRYTGQNGKRQGDVDEQAGDQSAA